VTGVAGGTGDGQPSDPAGLAILDTRPLPGQPRTYRFPGFRRERLDNGLTILTSHLPGRPLLAAQVLLEGGAGSEPANRGGVTVLTAEAMSEGTARRSAIEMIEASERLGASLHADAGWETLAASLEVPARRFGPALELLAEMLLTAVFPEREVDRLRDERLNDLLQARAEPRRRAERAFLEAIYAPSSPFGRPIGGNEATVPGLDRAAVVERHGRLLDPSRATVILAGDLTGVPAVETISAALGAWTASGGRTPAAGVDVSRHPAGRRVVLVDRPGSPQTEVRIGHVGLPRLIPDYHAVVVTSAILGGLFNSRLQRLLREERGYTYGVGAGFELRRAAGPFAVRMAVQTDVTVPAIDAALGELRRMRESTVSHEELEAARDYLIGVFPLRFEVPAQVVAAIAGIVVVGLPDDELDRYRPAVAAVTAEEVQAAAAHIEPDSAVIALVGDAARIESGLHAAGFGPVEVVSEPLFSGEGAG
jgi:zinc protease